MQPVPPETATTSKPSICPLKSSSSSLVTIQLLMPAASTSQQLKGSTAQLMGVWVSQLSTCVQKPSKQLPELLKSMLAEAENSTLSIFTHS